MQEEKNNVVMLAGNTNKGENVMNQPVIMEDSLTEFISGYFGDAAKGPSVAKYIDTRFHGNADEAIATMIAQESTKPLAMALIEYQVYLETMERMKKEAAEANRPKRARKDPVIRHEKVCEICGNVNPNCREATISGAILIVCPNCNFEDSEKTLTDDDRYNFLMKEAGLSEAENVDNYPVITVPVKRGLPQHPKGPGYRLTIPRITEEEKKLLGKVDKVTVQVIGIRNEWTAMIRIMKIHEKQKAEKKTFFAQIFYKDGNIHVQAAGITKRISLPREKREDITVRRELWGMWKMEVIKEADDFIFALPVEKVEDEKIPEQQDPKVFFATVRVYDEKLQISSDKKKRITVPREMMPRLRYGLGVWKMRVISEGDDYIFSKPIERINSKGINQKEYAARLNQLQTTGKLEL